MFEIAFVTRFSSDAALLASQPTLIPKSGLRPSVFASPVDLSPRAKLRMGYYLYKSIGTLLNVRHNSVINSMVMGVTVNNPLGSVQLPENHPVTFTFYHFHREGVTNPRCVYWDTMAKVWSTLGCSLISTSETETRCSCTHMTSFAILMDINANVEELLSEPGSTVLDIITMVGCALSIICLFFSFLVFTCFRSLWSVRNTIHQNLCLSLMLAEFVFVFGIDATNNRTLCSIIAVALHFLFLASFCWMLLEGYQLYMMLIQVFEPDDDKILLSYIWAYGFPAIVVAVSAGVAWRNYGTPDYCWLNVDTPVIWTFIGPVGVVIAANFVFLGIALKVVLSVDTGDRKRSQRILGWLKGSAMLLCLLGITWVFGFLLVIRPATPVIAYIFTILNSAQGVFIFLLHVTMNEKVRVTVVRFVLEKLCCLSDIDYGKSDRSYLSSRQKFMKMIKPGKSFGSDKPNSTDSTDLQPGIRKLSPGFDLAHVNLQETNASKPGQLSSKLGSESYRLKDSRDLVDRQDMSMKKGSNIGVPSDGYAGGDEAVLKNRRSNSRNKLSKLSHDKRVRTRKIIQPESQMKTAEGDRAKKDRETTVIRL
ncbi:hypothetical protein AB6A40_007428 [Gnathostoma spinigerum]|uniref:Uncharacterized protein n=1 Tax=Gnathostoma spinigerum TaxID=75299 RepID=A0ABD6ETU9_9BILA